MNAYEQKVVSAVEESGWFGVHVFDPDGAGPNVTYSVGLTKTLECPEVIVLGFAQELAHALIWELFDQIKKAGGPLVDGERRGGLLKGFDCVTREVCDENKTTDYLNSAIWFWRKVLFRTGLPPVFQVLWPGVEDGLFPWEPGCAPDTRKLQPLLYLPSHRLM